MREAFPPSLPSGSPDLGKISTAATASTTVTKPQRKIITQQSCHQLETPKARSVKTIISGNSPKKDKDNSFIDFSKTRKTTTTKFGHQSPQHRNSSPNTKYNIHTTGSPTLKSDLKAHFERDSAIGSSGLTTTTSAAVATSNSTQTGTPPSVLALADTTADVALTKLTPLTAASSTTISRSFPGELEELQSVLHFPEEVALRITDAEYQLFYQVPPIEYFKHVILELQNENDASQKEKQHQHQHQHQSNATTSGTSSTTPAGTSATPPKTKSIPDLQKRFDEVCSWVTYLIMSQPTPQEQKAAFGCLLRAALSCWNIGNFNGAMEITTGLRSVPLKSQLSTYTEKGKIPVLDFLSAALESAEYERALARGLKMTDCRVIPCYKLFLKDLKEIMLTKPINFSLTAISYGNENAGDRSPDIDVEHISIKHTHHFPVGSTVVEAVNRGVQTNIRTDARSYYCKSCTTRETAGSCSSIINSRLVNGQVYISDYNGDDHYFAKIGSSGVLTADQIYKIQAVMDHIDSCHQHHHTLIKNGSNNLIDYLRSASLGNRQMAATSTYHPDLEELEEDYEVEIGTYNPVQPLLHDHGVCMIPISSPLHKIDHHILQIMHHGTTAVIWEPDATSGRSCFAFFRLERSCASITWQKPSWHRLKSEQEYDLAINPEELASPRLFHHHQPATANEFEPQNPTIDDGYLDLAIAKAVTMGSRNHEYDADLLAAGKRFGLTHIECCVTILYGNSLSDNRILCLMCPPMLSRLWYVGLNWIIKGIKRQQRLADRSMLWLKEKYVQLYFEDRMCVEPLANDALKLFGGRDWSTMHLTNATNTVIPETSEPMKREMSFKFRKKKSVANILGQSISGGNLINTNVSEPEHDDGSERRGDRFDRRRMESSEQLWQKVNNLRYGAITYDTKLDFLDFIALFKSFSLLMRKDLRDLFEQLAVTRSKHKKLNSEKSRSAPELCCTAGQRKIGLLTRNSSLEAEFTDKQCAQKKIFDGMCAASIVSNCAGIDKSISQVITLSTLKKFLETRQMEAKTEDEIRAIIKRHEPDPTLRIEDCLSFEGFARYLMDKDNYAFLNERIVQSTSNMDRPLSHYYIASSHNTYLTGHQLKGESSAELYSQVLLTGCRCVELDCWDGDDGTPVIYHGHTFTTKISFKSVVEAINRSAFVASPYPVILSIENHCSLQQQARMAHIFMTTFGDKLVTKFLFDSDYNDEPLLPSPHQLKNKILVKNKKLVVDVPAPMSQPGNRTSQLRHQISQPGRTSSIISNVSSGSVTEDFSDDEYDDEEDYDDEKTFHTIFGSVDERSSRHSLSSFATPTRRVDFDDKAKKRSSQIARELSDLVIYVQAIKFRGLNPISPQNSVRLQQPMPTKVNSSGSLVTVGSILKTSSISPCAPPPIGNNPIAESMQSSSLDSASVQSETTDSQSLAASTTTISATISSLSHRKMHHINVNHPCYQCASINEASAKKLFRKHPLALIAHTQTQLMRTYPAGLRIDSSNFNPVFFWAFGIQLVALNYQTDDLPMHINAAMFEENGSCGYVCKPDVLWDQTHLMYRRFNPLEKEFDGLHSSQIVINIVSGQFVQQSNLQASTYVEVEMIGIPVDCSKRKTRVIRRNAMNPIWNDTFFFKVMFHDLAFLKFSVIDNDTNHMVSQRVIPLKCLRPGYRHVRLRSPTNQPLSLAALFVYSRVEEESLERTSDEIDECCGGSSSSGYNKIDNIKTSNDLTKATDGKDSLSGTPIKELPKMASTALVSANIPLKRRMFFVMVYGVLNEEPFTILRATQESTTRELIGQALQKSNRVGQNVNDYILVEEVGRGWRKKDRDLPATQRVLDMHEKPIQAQAMWQGEGRFIFKKIGNDPSSRAWLTSITSIRRVSERRATYMVGEENESTSGAGDGTTAWDDDDTFLVCVYNVSPDIPYAILKAPINATAQDVLAQSLLKARRMENPNNFVLIEELEYGSTGSGSSSNTQQRALATDENIFSTQANWKTIGRFILQDKSQFTPSMMRRHRLAIDKISRGFSISRAAVLNSTASKNPIQPVLSDPTTARIQKRSDCSAAPSTSGSHFMSSGIFRSKGNSDKETTSCSPRRQKHREVHSEGETLSEDEGRMSSMFRLKKLSMKKLKAWKS